MTPPLTVGLNHKNSRPLTILCKIEEVLVFCNKEVTLHGSFLEDLIHLLEVTIYADVCCFSVDFKGSYLIKVFVYFCNTMIV